MPTKKTTEGTTKEVKPKAPAAKAAATKASAPKAAAMVAAKAPAKAKGEEFQKLRIRVRAYEHKILDVSVRQIIDTAMRYDAKVTGPVPLPAEIKKYTVNRSTFVHKNAREQFEIRTHKRLIDIMNPNSKVIEALTNLSLPSGVNIDVKMI